MLLFLCVMLVLLLSFTQVAGRNQFHSDYISLEQTTIVNGVFTVLVLVRHGCQYLNDLPAAVTSFDRAIGQLIVVSFLFYSGYGIMESIKKKGMSYVRTIPTRRFAKVWYHFAIAVALYIPCGLYVGRNMTLSDILLAFTGWTSIGNSNWYVFDTLILYLILFAAFHLARGRCWPGALLTAGMVFLMVVLFWQGGLAGRYYNTVLCFPLGMGYAMIRPKVERLVMRSDLTWLLSVAVTLSAFYFCYLHRKRVIFYLIWAVLWAILLVLLTMKLRVTHPLFQWMGRHVFSIYILQRLPMWILKKNGLNRKELAFTVLSFVFTLLLAELFDRCMAKLDRRVYREEKS